MDSDLRELIKKERLVKNSMKITYQFTLDYKKAEHEDEVEIRLQLLEESFSEFKEVRQKIELLLDEMAAKDTKPHEGESKQDQATRQASEAKKRDADNAEAYSKIENLYCKIKAKLVRLLPEDKKKQIDTTPAPASMLSTVKLPEIKLPQFSGKLRDWVTFRDAFKSLIHKNETISATDKFTYLRSSLTPEALRPIDNIEITAANYIVAWEALESQFENKKLIVKAHLDALFAVEPMKHESFESLNQVVNEFDNNLQMLRKIGENTEGWSTLLVHMLCSRLDPVTLRLWETEHNSKEVPKFTQLLTFLRNHCSVLQSVAQPSKPFQNEYRKPKLSVSHPTMSGRCCFCSKPFHLAVFCKKFQKMKLSERYDAVKDHGLCINCLSKGHLARSCSRGCCQKCGRKHNTLLHPTYESANSAIQKSSLPQTARRNPNDHQNQQHFQARPQNQIPARPHNPNQTVPPTTTPQSQSTLPQSATDLTAPVPSTSQNTVSLHSHAPSSKQQVLLSTAIVRVKDRFGNYKLARALLDSCSQYCFVTSKFCRKLNLEEFPDFLSLQGIGCSGGVSKNAVLATISPRTFLISDFEEDIQFSVLPRLTVTLPAESFDISRWEIPEDVVLADPNFHENGDIDMLIGAEYFLDLLQEGSIKLCEGGPTLQKTVFGWIVAGRIPDESNPGPQAAVFLCSLAELNDQLAKFWELETCHVTSTYSVEESLCEQIFRKTTIRDESGRYGVTLPKKNEVIQHLGDTRSSALKRFLSLERRFAYNLELKAMYAEFIHEYQSMGHMKEVEDELAGVPAYYLPHHAVLRPESTTTKLRVVFDASCRSTTGVSLNDGLMVGPVVQDNLFAISLRFRFHPIAIVADVEKMYRMINVQPSDQKLQRILWRESPNDDIREFQLTTVTYGTASAPYLATRCLQQLAEEGEASHPTAAKILKKDFYVDDMITGVQTEDEGKLLVNEMNDLMSSAGMTLRKWNSSHETILEGLPDHLRDVRAVRELDSSSSTIKTLGMAWDPRSDSFCFSVPKWNSASIITKRIVASDASLLFDPLGVVGPVVVQAKIFMQTLWKNGYTWDEPLPDDLQEYWREYRRNLLALETLSVPRWVGYTKDCVDVQLHGFCDASELAYGAALYLRCTHRDLSVTVHLITSKSRVATLEDLAKKKRKQSIPRLELTSALLLSHLLESFRASVDIPMKVFLWTDSMIVRCWLAAVPSRWKPFIANRVSEIQHLTRDCRWCHIPGTENPADIVSRGITPAQLYYQTLWWNGPCWLRMYHGAWPEGAQVDEDQFEAEVLEMRTVAVLPVAVEPPNDLFSINSSLIKTIRLVTICCRYRYNAQATHKTCRKLGPITKEEFEDSYKLLIAISQRESFPRELADLKRGDEVKDSSEIHALHPQLVDGLIRVGGRLRNAPVSENRKHPIVLHHHHPLSKLVLTHYHEKFYHAGQQLLIANVREEFWITSIRNLTRMVIHQCVDCFKAKPSVLQQLMADLPPERVNPAPPFLKVGVDYCGPFLVTYPDRRRSPKKCFVAVFVCLVSKAVHLELVADLTTEAFVAALRRFVARRGRPAIIMCDNAKNFVGAKRELKELLRLFLNQQFQEAVIANAVNERIEFKFIPARSPNFGGLWEAAVKSFKSAFKRTIGTRTLQYDEMVTVLTQVEAVLNSRPLTPISNDPGDFEALTPGHFLVQRPLTAIAGPDLEEVPANRLSMWQRAQNYVQMLWKKWTTLYLSDLHNRTKWTKTRDNIAVGTMVLSKDERLPPLRWPLGRVTKVFRGPDNNVRVVTVRTQNGEYLRAISKICVLPIRDNVELANEEN